MTSSYETVIGIETHVQLNTRSKLFCSCSNDSRDAQPNTNLCPVCLGLPGSLPVLNARAVRLALQLGYALNAKMGGTTKFDRKNYFYPDLPKGYQISQFDQPIVGAGYVELPSSGKKIGITRAHLEEDAGKLVHPEGAEYSLVDLNRAGTPLMEVVSEPDIGSPAEAKEYITELYNIVRYAGVSDADLFQGNMRFDVNVSVRPAGSQEHGTRSETKNLNSFRAVEKAAEYEAKRQTELLGKGKKVVQETRGWDEAKGITTSLRSKEEAHDYRYFPEPDIPPIVISNDVLDDVKKNAPKLPKQIRHELSSAGLGGEAIETLLSEPEQVEQLLSLSATHEQLRGVAKYYSGKIRSYQNEHPNKHLKIEPNVLLELYKMQTAGKVGSSAVDEILTVLITDGGDPEQIAKAKKLIQVSDRDAITRIVSQVIKDNETAVTDYKSGNTNSLQFLVGQVMKESKGQANPAVAREILQHKLKVVE